VRREVGRLSPQGFVDAPPLVLKDVEDRLRSTTRWLTPWVVDGFDEADFSFLPDAERASLAKRVRELSEVAAAVNPTLPPPIEAVEKALPLFLGIVEALAFDRYDDDEALRLGKLIECVIEPFRPRELADLRFRTGLDHTGDPGLWIWAFLSDEASKTDDDFLEAAGRLRALIGPFARRIAPDRFPYLSFRALKDQFEPVEAS